MAPRVILCLDMDAFFASVERVRHPELRGRPIIVGGSPEGRGVVTSASYEARAYGVHAAMPLGQARRLCPHAALVSGDFDAYRQASHRVHALLHDLSPFVEMASIDEAFVDLSGTARTLGAPLEAARRLKETIRGSLGLPCSIGVAANKLVAKVVCSRSKPNGLREVPPGQEAAFLAPLPVTAVPGIGERTAGRLAEVSIHTCGQLAAAPLLLLQRILGRPAGSWQRRAQGVDDAPVAYQERSARSISRSATFAQDSRDPQFLHAILGQLVERVGRTLRQHGWSTTCVAVQVRWADFVTQGRQQVLPQPAASDARLYEVSRAMMDDMLAHDRRRMRLLGVEVSHFVPLGLQLPLLLPERAQEQRALELSRCLDRIRGEYGSRAIQRGWALLLRDRSHEVEGGDW